MNKYYQCVIIDLIIVGEWRFLKKIILFLIIASLSVSLCSCSSHSIISSVDSLIVPPDFYAEYDGLVSVFNDTVSADCSFCAPSSGDYRSAVVFYDVDGDKTEEALIFYTLKEDPNKARFYLFDYGDGFWQPVGECAGFGSAVESVNFIDMDSSGRCEILVSWIPYAASADKFFSVYSCANGIEQLSSFCYSVFEICDMDSDGKQEIFYIERDSVSIPPYCNAKLIKIENSVVYEMGSVKLDAGVRGHSSVKAERVSDSSPLRLYIDAFKGEDHMITELVYWDNELMNLVAPFLDNDTMTNTVTSRKGIIPSVDVNNDGTIDIPVLVPAPEKSGSVSADVIQPVSWMNYTDDKFVTVCEGYVNPETGFAFIPSSAFPGYLNVTENESGSGWTVCADSEGKEIIFSVIPGFGNDNKTIGDTSVYTESLTPEGLTVYCSVGEYGEESGITPEIISGCVIDLFSLIS